MKRALLLLAFVLIPNSPVMAQGGSVAFHLLVVSNITRNSVLGLTDALNDHVRLGSPRRSNNNWNVAGSKETKIYEIEIIARHFRRLKS